MKKGKIPEAVLIRSVLKQLHKRRKEVAVGPAVGQDCAALCLEDGEALVLSSDPITGTTKDIGRFGALVTTNDIAAAGAEPVGIILTMLLPEDTTEAQLKQMISETEESCGKIGVEVIGGHTEITDAVVRPVISVTGVGKIRKNRLFTLKSVHEGDDLVVTKWIALEATSILAKEKREELLKHFPDGIVDAASNFDAYLSVIPESKIAMEHGMSAMHDVTEGGIFGALWEMGSGSGCGLEADLKKIPIRQESVEICEYFDINPYLSMSSGSMLIASPDGAGLVKKLKAAGIPASVIGRMTPGNDRIVRNGEEVRYLDKPQTDELYKVL